MAINYHKVELKTIVQICDTLDRIISHSLGPRGSKILLATETGQVIISSDGKTVLRKLQFGHPIARLIIDSMTRTVNFTGDGSKTFILYLSKFFHELLQQEFKSTSHNDCVCAIQKIKFEINSKLASFIKSKIPGSERAISSVTVREILRTSLSNSFQQRIIEHYVTMVNEAVCIHGQDDYLILNNIKCMVDNFDLFCVKVPSLPYSESKTLSPFLIQRRFAVFCQNNLIQYVRFLICLFPITGHPKNVETREIISLTNESSLIRFMDHHHCLLKKFVDMCKRENIQLILCSEQVSDQALQLFELNGISIVHYVPEEDYDWLLSSLKISPCTSIFEKLESNMVHSAKSCKPFILNGRQCVHLELDCQLPLPKMLIVCAPTEGLCNQAFLNLQKSLKTISSFLNSNNQKSLKDDDGNEKFGTEISVIGAGGSFEFLVSEFLSEYSQRESSCSIKLLCKILNTAVLQLPRILFHNNSPTKQLDLKLFLVLLEKISKARHAGKYLGIDRNGQEANLFDNGVLELFEPKIHILLSVLELIQQVLRIDYFVGVKNITQNNENFNEHDV
ncbi:BBSome complex assembly protein BBS10-like [Mytilus edulis]|uniref:BBSome complex assembly protein BBS10-like n=1 Tax=Mytilus edulis TaxID=6550 RepID=UPI0039EEA7F8